MRVHFGGHLAYYRPDRQPWAEVHITGMQLLEALISELGIPPGEIAIFAVNGEAVDPENTYISDEDEVRIYPPTNGG